MNNIKLDIISDIKFLSRCKRLWKENYCLGMNEKQVRSILSQLGMFMKKKAEEDISMESPTSEWMSAWETKSSDGVNIVFAILLTENEKDITLLRNKMNEFAIGAKIEFKGLFEMERD